MDSLYSDSRGLPSELVSAESEITFTITIASPRLVFRARRAREGECQVKCPKKRRLFESFIFSLGRIRDATGEDGHVCNGTATAAGCAAIGLVTAIGDEEVERTFDSDYFGRDHCAAEYLENKNRIN